MKASDLFVKCLENEGVKYIFGVPGEEMEDVLFSLKDSSIKFIPTRHEQGAAFMADVWGRLSGRAGVCFSTLGPGATNLVTGVADANLDKSPLVAISAQAGLQSTHKESHQYIDLVQLFRPITKWNTTIATPSLIPEVVRKAFKIAESEKPGATHIEFPEDIAGMNVQGRGPIVRKHVRRPDPDESALGQAASLIRKSRKPLIISGNGILRHQASQELGLLVKQTNIPIVHTFMGKGSFPTLNPQCLFNIGLGFRDFVMQAVEESDLIITAGYDIAEYSPEKWNVGKRKKIIHIDFTPAEVYEHYQPTVEIVADISVSLRELAKKLSIQRVHFDGKWYKPIRDKIIKDIGSYVLRNKGPFTVPGVLNTLQSMMGSDDLLISDVGTHKLWIARNFTACCPNGCIISNGLASMGIALPGAIAASLYDPKRRVVAAMGDGGFLMNSQELETAKRLNLSFTVIIFNDNDYGLISWKQHMSRGKSTGTKITNPDFKKYVESFGIKAYAPKSPQELSRQLKNSLHKRELSAFIIPVDVSVNNTLIQRLKKYEEAKNGKH